MLVDAHTHLLPERLARAIRDCFKEHIAADFPYPCEAPLARERLRAAGVTRCWSLPYAHRPGMASALNRWMAESFPPEGPMVIPGGTLHPGDDVSRLLDEALGELRLRALKLHCAVGAFSPDDPRLDPVWKRVSESGHPVVVHVGRSSLGTTGDADLVPLERVAERWPEARIVVAHCGAPAVAPTLALLRRARSVHADLTPVVGSLVPLTRGDIEGLERKLLFGSDVPNTTATLEETLALVRSWGLPADQEAAILGGNANALLS
jgi:predicted TIM-barrel fold metal-dependent hydrolase